MIEVALRGRAAAGVELVRSIVADRERAAAGAGVRRVEIERGIERVREGAGAVRRRVADDGPVVRDNADVRQAIRRIPDSECLHGETERRSGRLPSAARGEEA